MKPLLSVRWKLRPRFTERGLIVRARRRLSPPVARRFAVPHGQTPLLQKDLPYMFQIEAEHLAGTDKPGMRPFQYARRMDCTLTPSSWASSLTDNNVGFIPFLSLGDAHDGADHTVMHG